MEYQKPITLHELIEIVRTKKDQGQSYCIYGKADSSEATLSSTCYLDSYAEITDDYEEIYSKFVTDNNLELWFREELVQDVIYNAISQNNNVTNEKIIEAILYYDDNDCFLSL